MSKKSYKSTSIDVLQNVDHIRKRPNMYIQNTASDGLHQLVYEVLANCIDEYMGGYLSKIDITVEDNVVSVRDNGRGIPYDIHPKTQLSTLTTVLTYTGSGGKFDHKTYGISAGLHGVGITVVNALSEWLTAESATTDNEDVKAVQKFKRGVPVTEVETTKNKAGSGFYVIFKPDQEIFGDTAINIDIIKTWVQELSYLCAGLEITVNGDRYYNKFGLKAYLEDILERKNIDTLHDPVVFKSELVDLIFCWTDNDEEICHSFVNSSRTPDGGTHVVEFRKAITKAIGPGEYQSDDLRIGLITLLHVKVADPQFKGQTKGRLLNKEVGVDDAIADTLSKFVATNQKVIKDIVGRAVRVGKARETVKKEKQAIRSIGKKKRGILPGKLTEAPKAKPADRELYIVEGDSAAGTVRWARDAACQEVLPLRGKIPNATKLASLLNNEEIQAIIASIGCGIGEECNPQSARVGKVMLLMDADPDGKHIASLCLTFLFRYMKPLIEAGMVYVVESPLYVSNMKDERCFGYSLEDVQRKLPKGIVSRLKGHGEASPAELKHYAMSTKTRRLKRILMTNFECLAAITGNDTEARRAILGIV